MGNEFYLWFADAFDTCLRVDNKNERLFCYKVAEPEDPHVTTKSLDRLSYSATWKG